MTACHAIHISKNKEFVLLFICFSNCVLLACIFKERGVILDQQSEQH